MKRFIVCQIMLPILLSSIMSAQSDRSTNVHVFMPSTTSAFSVKYSCALPSSKKEVYFAASHQKWGGENLKSSIYHAVRKNGKWSMPKIVSFSGKYDDSDPHLSKDGNRMYFVSDRPSKGVTTSADIWMVVKNKNGRWGDPIWLPYPINSAEREYSPRTDREGNLYFASDRPGGYGQGDLYISYLADKRLGSPVNMGNTINSSTGEWNLEINDSADILLFEASQRDQNVSSYGDLYISFKHRGRWATPQNIKELNTSGSDLYPFLTRDENSLYFTSSNSLKSTTTTIYHVEIRSILKNYKKTAVLPKK